MAIRFTRAAEEDLLAIYLQGSAQFGIAQADRYVAGFRAACDLIEAMPQAVRERTEFVPPVRIHPYKSHIIIFRIEDDGTVLVIRVRHGHEDWASDPTGGDGGEG